VVTFLPIDGDLVARADPVLMAAVFENRVHGTQLVQARTPTEGYGDPKGSNRFGGSKRLQTLRR
jgi:hypothetical protein